MPFAPDDKRDAMMGDDTLASLMSNPLFLMGASILANNTGGRSTGEVLGRGLLGGTAAWQGMEGRNEANAYRNMQIRAMQDKMERQKRMEQAWGALMQGQGSAGGAMPGQIGALESYALLSQDPDLLARVQQLKIEAMKASPAYVQQTEGIKAAEGARYAPDIVREGPQGEKVYTRPLDATGVPGVSTGGTPRSATPGDIEQQKGIAKLWTDRFDQAMKDADAAGGRLATLNAMSDMLPKFETGKLTPAVTELQAWAQSLGVDLGDPAKVDAKQAFESLSKRLALENRNPAGGAGMPGALSDKDREFLEKTVPALEKTKGANVQMIDIAKRIAQRSRDVSYIMQRYLEKYGRIDSGVERALRQYSQANPLFPEAGR